jgi:hypothetical protein
VVNRDCRNGSYPSGGDRHLRAVYYVAGGENISYRSVEVQIGYDAPDLVARAAELATEVVRRLLTDREEDLIAIEGHSSAQLQRSGLASG